MRRFVKTAVVWAAVMLLVIDPASACRWRARWCSAPCYQPCYQYCPSPTVTYVDCQTCTPAPASQAATSDSPQSESPAPQNSTKPAPGPDPIEAVPAPVPAPAPDTKPDDAGEMEGLFDDSDSNAPTMPAARAGRGCS